jgi:hypothetical protein
MAMVVFVSWCYHARKCGTRSEYTAGWRIRGKVTRIQKIGFKGVKTIVAVQLKTICPLSSLQVKGKHVPFFLACLRGLVSRYARGRKSVFFPLIEVCVEWTIKGAEQSKPRCWVSSVRHSQWRAHSDMEVENHQRPVWLSISPKNKDLTRRSILPHVFVAIGGPEDTDIWIAERIWMCIRP